MELRRFTQFVALAEEGSFTQAAARLFMSQSALSESIATLENELGVQLFTRGRHGTTLTAAGQSLLEPARLALQGFERAKNAATLNRAGRGLLRILNTYVSAGVEVERAATEMSRRHPDINFDVSHYGMRSVAACVADDEADIAFTPIQYPLPSSVEYRPLPSVEILVLCPKGHRLDGATELEISDLAGETFIRLPEHVLLSRVSDSLSTANDDPRAASSFAVRTVSWLNAVSLVRRGFGITLGPKFAPGRYPDGIGFGAFATPPIMESAIIINRASTQQTLIEEYIAIYNSHRKAQINYSTVGQ